MIENKLSKKEFARLCGLSVFKLDRFLNNQNIKLQTLYNICEFTKIKCYELLNFHIQKKK
jgi:DNA-binding Xre family transcriptional regulator